jgi:hypothetical protein
LADKGRQRSANLRFDSSCKARKFSRYVTVTRSMEFNRGDVVARDIDISDGANRKRSLE